MDKIKKIQQKMSNLDYIFLINTNIKDPNMLYCTSINLEYSFLVIPKNKSPLFFVSPLEYQRAKRDCKIKQVKIYKNPLKEIHEIIGDNKTIGINSEYVSISTYKKLRKHLKCNFKPVEKIFSDIRVKKTKEEIRHIKKAASITDKIFKKLCKKLKENRTKFKTEKDLSNYIELLAKQYNTELSFETIVASGKNAALPHYFPKKTKICKGFCVIDFGIKYKNYVSDMTRTIFFGVPAKKDIINYEKVKSSNANAIKKLNVGIKCRNIDKISRKYIDYPHGVGHGIGIEVHENPKLNIKSKDIIQENMCFTIEPGLYVPNKFGIRIEDDICMTKKGPEVLTKSSKNLICFHL
ncbi:hypothetical protein COV16_05730 [Candidatus Woesearchaeota archaeon CG10_big_fil_rev_8_21_14_0_10_34_8]|nr:MAG: hypothetical protein COV16_05730 [Candidatus Woesearchaeota archaeon CG10_big_fil_rev_8_21_14_0_10_34_8]